MPFICQVEYTRPKKTLKVSFPSLDFSVSSVRDERELLLAIVRKS